MIKRRDPFAEFGVLLRGETAAALAQSGDKLTTALGALRSFDRDGPRNGFQTREDLVDTAAQILYGYIVQKELNGLADHDTLNRCYGIPAEVWHRVGVVRKRR